VSSLAWLLPALSALVGVVHVHHAPSHDSSAPFEEVLAAAFEAELDFVVLTDHAPPGAVGPLPAAERAGLYTGPEGESLLVLVGAEVGTSDGHLLALDVRELPRSGKDVSGAAAIDSVHALGGFAVVPHPFSHGGWRDWEAPFDGLEVHNNASAFSQLGLLIPPAVIASAIAPKSVLRFMLRRPERELERFETLLAERSVVAFSGADAHRNVSILGWRLDPYARVFSAVQTVCDAPQLDPEVVWRALRSGACSIRYRIHEGSRGRKQWVEFPSGRRERWLGLGRRVLEIGQRNGPGMHPRTGSDESRATDRSVSNAPSPRGSRTARP